MSEDRAAEAPHKDLSDPEYRACKEFLAGAELWSAEDVAAHQLAEVRRMVRHAHDHTSGYRRLFQKAGANPDDIRSLADVPRLPSIGKEQIRHALAQFSVALPGRSYVTTGGSTGVPFGFYRDRRSFSRELACKAHLYHRVGWKEGDRQLVLRGVPVEGSSDHTVFIPELNELRCSSYHLVPACLDVFTRKAWEYRPDWIRCYPSAGCLYARWLAATNRPFPPLKGILCASENLYDAQKDLLSRVFRTRVFSHYGHYEMAALAGFCERADRYHVLPQYGYAELIDDAGRPVTVPGQSGEIVATSFIMHATPFIRYRTQDRAVLGVSPCEGCRRPHQVWDRIDGRLQELIVTGSGRPVSMTALNFHDDIFDQVEQVQFHQRERGRLTCRYVSQRPLSAAALAVMEGRLLAKLGLDTALSFARVDRIALTERGKHRFLIQELTLEGHDR